MARILGSQKLQALWSLSFSWISISSDPLGTQKVEGTGDFRAVQKKCQFGSLTGVYRFYSVYNLSGVFFDVDALVAFFCIM